MRRLWLRQMIGWHHLAVGDFLDAQDAIERGDNLAVFVLLDRSGRALAADALRHFGVADPVRFHPVEQSHDGIRVPLLREVCQIIFSPKKGKTPRHRSCVFP